MNRIFHSLSLLLILAQWIAAIAAYPLMPRQVDVSLFGQVYAFGHIVSVNPRMADKERIFGLPAGALAIQAYLWYFPRASRWLFSRTSRPSLAILIITGLFAYMQCLVVSSAYYGPTDLICFTIFKACLGMVILTGNSSALYELAHFLFRYLAANWLMLRGRPLGRILDVPSRSVSASINERVWIDRHPFIASSFALAALIVFILCMTIGLPIIFTAAFTIAIAISVAPVFHSWMCGSPTPGAANSHAQAARQV